MFPCCDICYEKYIDEDGQLIKNSSMMNAIEAKLLVIEYNDISEEEKIMKKADILNSICMCLCHRVGMQILH